MNSRVLVLGDIHFPYCHPDTMAFLSALKTEYKPDRVVSIGDEVDLHALSFHDHDPDLPGAGDELNQAINCIKALESVFDRMDILESNHGSLVLRKAIHHGLPRKVFKTYNQVYGVSGKWRWHNSLTIKLSNGSPVFFCHSKGSCVLRVSMSLGMSVVSGHLHEKMGVQYWANSLGLYFAAQTGCLVDDDSLAMAYNKLNLKRPLIGSMIILDGIPKILPMVLNKRGRWTGVVP